MMLATETRVQVSILGYLFSDLKEGVGCGPPNPPDIGGVGCRVWGVGCGVWGLGKETSFIFPLPTPQNWT
ncbi:hypothetical protein [Microcystis sp. LE19-8.1F]|uniref:hypothetical protein n=1 Tax=Microcystis sp. LE19-8.1F TaxID=3016437 RepID=UPI0022C7EABA|nr:hypothetical protein [Microcystis sp. LE19-8.1F]MCZ8211683.1 hypothetical protein [Microcystis sp. LE19-8.1F]